MQFFVIRGLRYRATGVELQGVVVSTGKNKATCRTKRRTVGLAIAHYSHSSGFWLVLQSGKRLLVGSGV